MAEPNNSHFYACRISGRPPGSPNQLFLLLEAPRHLNKLRTTIVTFKNIALYKFQNSKQMDELAWIEWI